MHYQTKKGDILQNKKGVIIHGCNSDGVMGAGLAAQVQYQYPQAYNDYLAKHTVFGLDLGTNVITYVNDDLIIVNAITQQRPGRDASKLLILSCLLQVIVEGSYSTTFLNALRHGFHFPQIGCGIGGLSWEKDVELLFDNHAYTLQHVFGEVIESTLWNL
jgi:O-acetyl-ADP-ribose deacetylase (regulator of RNase III)